MFEQTSHRAEHVASSVTRRGLLLSLGRWASPECSPRADRRGRHERRPAAVGRATSRATALPPATTTSMAPRSTSEDDTQSTGARKSFPPSDKRPADGR
jgi:hypothetical protein